MARTITKMVPNKHIAMEVRIYRLQGIEPLLASQPADKDIRRKYIAGKIADQNIAKYEQEIAMFDANPVFAKKSDAKYDADGNVIEKYNENSGLSVFMTDPSVEGNPICLMSSHICGFLKESLGALEKMNGIKMPRKKVDLYVRPLIPYPLIMRENENGEEVPVGVPDGEYTRTVRTEAAIGRAAQTVLKTSHRVDPPWFIDMPIALIPNKGSAASNPVTWDDVEQALSYGGMNGLGEFRTSGMVGRFEVYRIDDPDMLAKYSLGTEAEAARLMGESVAEATTKRAAKKSKLAKAAEAAAGAETGEDE